MSIVKLCRNKTHRNKTRRMVKIIKKNKKSKRKTHKFRLYTKNMFVKFI